MEVIKGEEMARVREGGREGGKEGGREGWVGGRKEGEKGMYNTCSHECPDCTSTTAFYRRRHLW